ncbi:MAG: hypothetical protein ACR2OZ_06805 [Verrucomicrobiales bacterium]
MFLLRLCLLFGLAIGGAYLAFHVPWKASVEVNGITHTTKLDAAPYFRPPGKPRLEQFNGKVSPYLDPKTVVIQVWMDKVRLFARFAGLVVGAFFMFGVIGYFLDQKPVGLDVAFSLSLTSGFLAASVLCVLVARVAGRSDFLAWLPFFWAVGVVVALLATLRARRVVVRSVR